MTMKGRNTLGTNKKDLKLNLICQFVLNSWEDKVNPEVKILYFDVQEDKTSGVNNGKNSIDDFDEEFETIEKKSKKKQVIDDDDFDW